MLEISAPQWRALEGVLSSRLERRVAELLRSLNAGGDDDERAVAASAAVAAGRRYGMTELASFVDLAGLCLALGATVLDEPQVHALLTDARVSPDERVANAYRALARDQAGE